MTSGLAFDLRVHIGFPKSASSSLQVLLQASCPAYLGKSFVHPLLREWFREIIPYAAAGTWQHNIDNNLTTLADVLTCRNLPLSQAIVSDEMLSGFDISNFFSEQRTDALLILSRLRQIFRSVKVLIIFRNQSALFKSCYSYLVGFGYNLCYQIFIEQILSQKNELGQMLYLADWLARLTPLDLTLVPIPFEALVQREPALMELLSEFFQVPISTLPHVNPSAGQDALWQQFQQNLTKPDGMNSLMSPLDLFRTLQRVDKLSALGSQALYALDPATEQELEQLLGRENRKLASGLPWDLEKYGYWLE